MGKPDHRGEGGKGNVVMFRVAFYQLDEVWDWGRGKGINQVDTSGGGKMIRIMVNKTA